MQKGKEKRAEKVGSAHNGLYFVWKERTHIYVLGKKGNICLITKKIIPEIILLEVSKKEIQGH